MARTRAGKAARAGAGRARPAARDVASPARTAAVAALLFASTALLFAPAIGFEFIRFDDPVYVVHNPHVLGGPTVENLWWAFTSRNASGNWHPSTWISYMIDATAWGDDPRGYHATSVLLHAANAALLFLALRRWTGAFWTSAACAALFAWHPLRVESVAWVSERKDVLSGFFFLITLWAWAARFGATDRDGDRTAATAPAARRSGRVSLAAFALGLMSKPMLVTTPFVLLLLDVWPLRRLRIVRRAAGTTTDEDAATALPVLLREKIPFGTLALASIVVTYLAQSAAGADFLRVPTGVRAANAVVSIARYLGAFFWPVGLAPLYPYPAGWSPLATGGALALVLGLSAVAVRELGRRPWIAVGWFWFLGMLVPVIGIVQVGLQSMADRYTYLPIIGLQVAILWTVRAIARDARARAIATSVVVAILLALAAETHAQLAYWHDTRTLFEHAALVTTDNYRAHQFAADAFMDERRFVEARAHYRRLLEIDPPYLDPQLIADNVVTTHFNLGLAALALSDANDAALHFRAVLERNPGDAEANANYGAILTKQGKYEDARRHLETALAADPDRALVHANLAALELAAGRLDEAIAHDRRALALAPGDVAVACRLAASLEAHGPAEEAARARADAARRAGPAGCPRS